MSPVSNKILRVPALKFFLFTGSLIFATCAIARIGETLDECSARYGAFTGPPIGVPASANTYYFNKNGLTITVIMLGDRAGSVIYSSPEPMLDSLIAALLENNSQGSKWSVGEGATARGSADKIMRKEIIYERADGKAEASYNEVGNYNGLQVRTKEFMRSRVPGAAGL